MIKKRTNFANTINDKLQKRHKGKYRQRLFTESDAHNQNCASSH